MCQERLKKLVAGKHRIIFYFSIVILMIGSFFVWGENQSKLDRKTPAEISDYITEKMTDCYKNDNTNKCYKANAEDFINQFKISSITTVFNQNEKKSEFFKKCHLVAHYLGQAAYRKYGSIIAVFLQGNRACLGGVYHGAVEGYFMEQGITDIKSDKVKQLVSRVCGVPEDFDEPQKFTECNHGLGHATMLLTENDLPQALNLCDALSFRNEQELCYSGALMANADSFGGEDHPTKYIKADDPLYPCDILEQQQKRQCYIYGVLARFQNDLSKSISVCSIVPTEFQNDCFETIGRDRTMISADPAELKMQCGQIKKDEWRKDCISGTSYNLVIRFGAVSNIPIDYCDITETKYKNDCYMQIFRGLKRVTRKKEVIENFCGKITDGNYRNECLNSI